MNEVQISVPSIIRTLECAGCKIETLPDPSLKTMNCRFDKRRQVVVFESHWFANGPGQFFSLEGNYWTPGLDLVKDTYLLCPDCYANLMNSLFSDFYGEREEQLV